MRGPTDDGWVTDLAVDPINRPDYIAPQQHWDAGHFWPDNVLLTNSMYWDAWAMFRAAGYLISDGYGGAHALLWGANLIGDEINITGNITSLNGSTSYITSFGTSDGPQPGEWGHHAVAITMDGHGGGPWIVCYWNGVPCGRFAIPGTRSTTSAAGFGAGQLYIGGSTHQCMNGRLAALRAFDNMNGAQLGDLPFVPERALSGQKNAQGWRYANGLWDFSRPAATIPDLAPDGQDDAGDGLKRRHPATPSFAHYGADQGVAPTWVQDPACPYGRAGDLVNYGQRVCVAPPTPAGALVFDSFSRAQQTFAYSLRPSLGATEGGSRGPLQWRTEHKSGAAPAFSGIFGILNGRAVLLDNLLDAALATVDAGTPDVDVRVDRKSAQFGTGLVWRYQDRLNYWYGLWFAFDYWHFAKVVGGVLTRFTVAGPSNVNWHTLRAVAKGSTTTLYVDDGAGGWQQLGQVTDPDLASATGVGLTTADQGYQDGMWRADNVTVFPAP